MDRAAIWAKEHKYVYQKAYYQRHRDRVNALKARPCTDCGVQYPPHVMQFDHVRGEKKFTISMNLRRKWEDTAAEIEKCDVVCANCHAERTWQRLQSDV